MPSFDCVTINNLKEKILSKNSEYYIPEFSLTQQTIHGEDIPLPDPLAEGQPHTTLGIRDGSDHICYRQSATFPSSTWPKANGYDVPWGRVDWTDRDRPSEHPNPRIHEFRYNWEQKRWESGLQQFWWYRRDVD